MKENAWLLPSEVVVHNTPKDIWVVVAKNRVLNITELIKAHINDKRIGPLLEFAGKNISHWFDHRGNFKTYIKRKTGNSTPLLSYGEVLDVLDANEPWKPEILVHNKPWWKNNIYLVGYLTKNARPLKMLNSLTGTTIEMEVCEEETFNEIAKRYAKFNKDWALYKWSYAEEPICMNKTLIENKIIDERRKFRELVLPDDFYVPTILLIFNDDCDAFCDNFDAYTNKVSTCSSSYLC